MKINDDDRRIIFLILVLLTGLPVPLFLFGVISRETAYLFFLAAVGSVMVYLVASFFMRNACELSELSVTTKVKPIGPRDFDSSEVETVQLRDKG
ncbi:MAG: hypothetical protein IPN69_03075 [Acidobacteria bacterium]|nr:hypothetical protein [Acidobacteriota bacterium]